MTTPPLTPEQLSRLYLRGLVLQLTKLKGELAKAREAAERDAQATEVAA